MIRTVVLLWRVEDQPLLVWGILWLQRHKSVLCDIAFQLGFGVTNVSAATW